MDDILPVLLEEAGKYLSQKDLKRYEQVYHAFLSAGPESPLNEIKKTRIMMLNIAEKLPKENSARLYMEGKSYRLKELLGEETLLRKIFGERKS